MSRYIDADNLYEKLEKRCYEITKCCGGPEVKQYIMGFREAIDTLKNEPVADVEEVRHGKWICRGHNGQMEYAFECSVCERWMFTDFSPKYVVKEYPYCHCGVKMDSVEKLEDEE